jgi:hypothetical protein
VSHFSRFLICLFQNKFLISNTRGCPTLAIMLWRNWRFSQSISSISVVTRLVLDSFRW